MKKVVASHLVTWNCTRQNVDFEQKFGIFKRKSSGNIRQCPTFEGSLDGTCWDALECVGNQFFYNFTFFILCNFISSPPLINGLRISKIWQILKCFILGHFIINKNLLFLKSVQYYSYNISTDVIDDFPNKDFTFWGRHRWNAENGHGCAFN